VTFLEITMTPRRTKNLRKPPSPAEPLTQIHPHAAGIDVHLDEHWVAVPPDSATPPSADLPSNLPPHVRKFRTCTADLEMLADWLTACGITTVAMESTGIYWIPLFELLERRGFQVNLIDPRQTKHVPGRPKSDCLDCQWIQRLHSYGLLAPSFRPADDVVVLRSYLRQRLMLISYGSQHVAHMHKALEQMNVKLSLVISDITGVTGMAIMKAILAGERDPLQLACLRDDRCKCTQAEIARALYGNWREDHLFELQQAVSLYQTYQAHLHACDQRLETYLKTFPDKSGGKKLGPNTRKRQRRNSALRFDTRTLLHRFSGVDLTIIEGIDEATALVVLSEIGRDMSKWSTEKHFVSWLGLCPVKDESNGKDKKRRRRRHANRATRAFRLAAQGCHHAKTALGAFYRRIQARCGGPKAVLATARKIAERVYRLLKYGEEYVRQDMASYEETHRRRTLKGLARKAQELGYYLVPQPAVDATP
jgi:transposase